MTTPDEKDVIGEVCREDAAERAEKFAPTGGMSTPHKRFYSPSLTDFRINTSDPREMQMCGACPGCDGDCRLDQESPTPIIEIDALRQQLADVSHERDLLREKHGVISAAYLQLLAALGNEDMDHTDALAVISILSEVKS